MSIQSIILVSAYVLSGILAIVVIEVVFNLMNKHQEGDY